MCRLFGFRSVIQSQVHSSLVSAENALGVQGQNHPDGWGVAYYIAGTPHLIKSDKSTVDDTLFKKVSGVVSSQTVLAHVRKATEGALNILNTHPFQFGNWVFAHNGNIKNFDHHKEQILSYIDPELKRFILGSTDSELIFFFILTKLKKEIDLSNRVCPYSKLEKAVKLSMDEIQKIIGPHSLIDNAGESETYLTFLMTNGESMIAHQGGKQLFYSTYKRSCPDRDSCSSFSEVCEAATSTGYVNHLIFASEPLSGDNIWLPMELGETLGVDSKMKIELK